jgi:uncharacterized HAD superfamily protein
MMADELEIDINDMSQEKLVEMVMYYSRCMNHETDELVDEFNWKVHRKNSGEPPVMSNVLEEWIDIFKYWLSIGQLCGFDPAEFLEEFHRKSDVVEQRYLQEHKIKIVGNKIIGVDIDGVLADYPRSFVEFINERANLDVDPSTITSYNIYEQLPITAEEGRRLKHEYRESGQKKFIPVLPGAKKFLEWFKQNGYTIVLLTARPYDEYKRIFADTMYWLEQNNLPYHMILWDEDKGQRLVDEFGDNVCYFIDDVPEYVSGVAQKGIESFLVNRPYNAGSEIHNESLVTRVDGVLGALNIIKGENTHESASTID